MEIINFFSTLLKTASEERKNGCCRARFTTTNPLIINKQQ